MKQYKGGTVQLLDHSHSLPVRITYHDDHDHDLDHEDDHDLNDDDRDLHNDYHYLKQDEGGTVQLLDHSHLAFHTVGQN